MQMQKKSAHYSFDRLYSPRCLETALQKLKKIYLFIDYLCVYTHMHVCVLHGGQMIPLWTQFFPSTFL